MTLKINNALRGVQLNFLRGKEAREAGTLPSPPLHTTQWRPVLSEKGSSAREQNKDDVGGAAYTSENEERKDGDADERADLESAYGSDREEDRGTSQHESSDGGVC
jgi:hypothetical protein